MAVFWDNRVELAGYGDGVAGFVDLGFQVGKS
jgi:hypothetical protein